MQPSPTLPAAAALRREATGEIWQIEQRVLAVMIDILSVLIGCSADNAISMPLFY
jgi:hypothetical protein